MWRCSLTEYSWCNMSSMALLRFSSCMGSFCWLRAFIQPVQSKNCTASSRPPSVDAASAEWYVQTTGFLNTECFTMFHATRLKYKIRKESTFHGYVMMVTSCHLSVLSLCSSHTFWVWPGSACLASPPCRSSSSTTCGLPVPPWGLPWPTSPTLTPSVWMFVSMVRE